MRASVTGIAVKMMPASRRPSVRHIERRHRNHGDQHVEEQLVGFLGGRFAIVAGNGKLHIGGKQRATQRLHAGKHAIGHRDGVGALALGNGECDGGPHGGFACRGVADVL